MNQQKLNEETKYLELLAEKYPTIRSVVTEIINYEALRQLPKGTEHFMSDLHGEHECQSKHFALAGCLLFLVK